MRINDALKCVYQNLPEAHKVAKCAITMTTSLVAIEIFSSIPGAAGGPITYAACIAACAFAAPPVVPFCLAACSPSLGPWCP